MNFYYTIKYYRYILLNLKKMTDIKDNQGNVKFTTSIRREQADYPPNSQNIQSQFKPD